MCCADDTRAATILECAVHNRLTFSCCLALVSNATQLRRRETDGFTVRYVSVDTYIYIYIYSAGQPILYRRTSNYISIVKIVFIASHSLAKRTYYIWTKLLKLVHWLPTNEPLNRALTCTKILHFAICVNSSIFRKLINLIVRKVGFHTQCNISYSIHPTIPMINGTGSCLSVKLEMQLFTNFQWTNA